MACDIHHDWQVIEEESPSFSLGWSYFEKEEIVEEFWMSICLQWMNERSWFTSIANCIAVNIIPMRLHVGKEEKL